MRSEDVQQFSMLMREVARTCRTKVADEEIAAYFRALSDLPFARVRERMTELQRSQKFFPSLALIRQQNGHDEASAGLAPHSTEWWREVRQLERALASANNARARRSRAPTTFDEELAEVDRAAAAAARGVALHVGTDEAEAWEKRYSRAAMARTRLHALKERQVLQALPPPTEPRACEEREQWLKQLEHIANAATAALDAAQQADSQPNH